MVTETHGKDGEYFVHPKYIFELANLFLSGPKQSEVVGLVHTTVRIPRKNTEIDDPVIQLPKCFEGTTSSMSQSEIKKEERVDDYFSKISVLLPMTILTLMIKSGDYRIRNDSRPSSHDSAKREQPQCQVHRPV